ncbi:MKRN2 opposite strand, tandem duplicate 1 isoform X2 [Brienomyrus brachyistius]|uniref:MKRN2 opposite strand, tandem duplicate 1 isoform X2 n=1 Tax=Brienomyrus brachyistius TaxID=42636 RepID=UPI0020B33A71|nr:MKRN2 opposite strand, tandem duplicate 1 isoform X2 [Brienomyrus brachyistius]
MDRSIIRFSHCDKYIYCFSFHNNVSGDSAGRSPSPHCPLCHSYLRFGLLDAPVSIRTPFDNGHAVPYALTIGSMHGPLYISERDNSELHVGITNSKGVVYNYTMRGIRRDETGWERCVAVRLVQPGAANTMNLWDRELERFALSDMWAPERFHEEREFGTCCYAFALGFINQVRAAGGKRCLTRDEFTATHILPRMKTTSTYVQIYREVLERDFYMIDKPRDGTG